MVVHVNDVSSNSLLAKLATNSNEKPTESFDAVMSNVSNQIKNDSADGSDAPVVISNKSNENNDVDNTTDTTLDIAPAVVEAANVLAQTMPVQFIESNIVVKQDLRGNLTDNQTVEADIALSDALIQENAGETQVAKNVVNLVNQDEEVLLNQDLSFTDKLSNDGDVSLPFDNLGSVKDSFEISQMLSDEGKTVVNDTYSDVEQEIAKPENKTTSVDFAFGFNGREQKDSLDSKIPAEDNFEPNAIQTYDVQNSSVVTEGYEISSNNEFKEQMTQQVLNQTIQRITDNLSNVSSFKNEIFFVLNPESLGKVAVKMIVEKGILTVELSAQEKETQGILASNLESIKEVLKNISTDNQVMQEFAKDYLQQENNTNQNQHNRSSDEQGNTSKETDDTIFTENFLSMLSIISAGEI